MSISEVKRLVRALALPVILAWVLSIPLAEAAFRVMGDRPSRDLANLFAQFINGTYKLAASVDTSADWAAGPWSVHTDSLGLRCDKARQFAVKPGTNLDVLFLGDSQGFGNGVNFEDTIAGSFAKDAAQDGKRVANVGVGGHGALDQVQIARWLSEQHQVDAKRYVLLMTSTMCVKSGGYAHAVVGADGRLYTERKSPLQMAVMWPKANTVLYSRIRNAVRKLGIGTDPSRDTPFVLQIFDTAQSDAAAESNLVHVVQQVRAFAAERKAALDLVYLPLTVEIEFDAVKEAASRRGITVDAGRPFRIATAAAQKLGLPLHDLRPQARKVLGEGQALHLVGDFHYSAGLSRACGLDLWNRLSCPKAASGE